MEHLDAQFGGQYDLDYDFEIYWKQVVEYVLVSLFITPLFPDTRLPFYRHCGIATDGTRVPSHPQAPLSVEQYTSLANSSNKTEVARPSDETQT